MIEYYYLISSLRTLNFYEKPPLPYPEFVEQCTVWLFSRDLHQLQLARIDIENIPPEKVENDLLNCWISFENTLRNELVKIRSKTLQIPEETYLRPESDFDPSARSLVHQAIETGSPYKAEVELVKIRWDFLSHHEVGHYFDLTALIVYGLKLQLLRRMQDFEEAKGKQILEYLVASVHSDISNSLVL
jgi:hypothetical protein